ncbi:hypothetical protein PAI11_12470 [Patulibacter medicamentivorans]|uniref:Integral membrane protein n=1 Tax=Patulibacter medicamentivorans TaxID=1097667 RepID=H0E379_9ACTN|nr:DUF4386 family protein [Patulibacter medicamentivorans]EHN11852.1 hypothetical protein PAI11_12470 [Patulibacter medicamentivorans]
MRPLTGVLLVLLPLHFNLCFALLAARFDYPDVLRRPTGEILERFAAGGPRLLLLWWSFALAPLALMPAAVLLAGALAGADPAVRQLAALVGVLAGLVQLLGLIRWPFAVPELARAHARATGDGERAAVDVVFQTLHRTLGVAIGEHLGGLLTGAWSVLIGVAVLQDGRLPAALGLPGLVLGPLLVLGSLEFLGRHEPSGWSPAGRIVPPAYVAWSLWLVALGVALLA